jgi:hypothetical protein
MPTAMEYAINKIIELSTELANIKTRTGCSTADMNEIMGFHTQDPDCDGIDEEIEEDVDERFDKLAKSADLIAEAQEKRIRLLEEDKQERMEDREKLLKRIRELEEAETKFKADIHTYQIQLHQLSDIMLRDKKKKPQLSPCMEDPITINGTLQP